MRKVLITIIKYILFTIGFSFAITAIVLFPIASCYAGVCHNWAHFIFLIPYALYLYAYKDQLKSYITREHK